MGLLNWNSDPRDDENETEIRGVMSIGIIVFVIAMSFLVEFLNNDFS